jgi:polysaccharide biosynthesis transport protein
LERARATERALEAQLEEMKARVLGEGRAMVELRELERVAEASRSIYQTFLTRAREISEQQRIDPSSAVILAQAEPARAPGGPGLIALAGAAAFAGLGIGAALGLRRDRDDPLVRSALQLEELAAGAVVHELVLPAKSGRGNLLRPRHGSDGVEYLAAPAGTEGAEAAARIHRKLPAADRRRGAPLLCLVTAAEPLQGKSTVALNLAIAASRAGDSVLLVDADRDAMAATQSFGADDESGLAEALQGTTACPDVIVKSKNPPVDLLPAGKLDELRATRAILDALPARLLAPLAGYDLVVVDASLVGRDRLTLALAGRADVALLAVQAGSGRKAAVTEAAGWLEGAVGSPAQLVLVRG